MIPMSKVTPVPSVFYRMSWDRPEEDEKFQRIQRATKKRKAEESMCLEKLCEESARCSIALSINNNIEEIIY